MGTVIDNDRFRKLLRARPADAVVQLHDLLAPKLIAYAAALTQDEDAAKDIVQDTFMTVFSKSRELARHCDTPIEHYLMRVIRFRSISHYKRVKHVRLDTLLVPDETGEDAETPVENSIIQREIILEIRTLIRTFPPREQECLLLAVDANLGLDEIARRLNITRKAVERSITSARKRLRAWGAKF